MEQFAPTARLVPQLLAKTNEEALAPVTVILVIDRTAAPVLVIVTNCEALEVPTIVPANVRLVGDRVTGPGAATPGPLNAMLCGEVLPLSVIVIAAVSAPVFVGAKCPWILQFAPAARLAPQLVPITKEDALLPLTAMLVIDNVVVPVLAMTTVCDALDAPTAVEGKVRLVADSVTGGGTPMPLSATLCGELPALSEMVMAAGRYPDLVGAKCPWIEQFAPTSRLDPQVFKKTNDEAFVPVTAMLEINSGTVPVLVKTRVWDALVFPSWTDPKLSEAAERATGKSTVIKPEPLIVECTVSVAVTECVPEV